LIPRSYIVEWRSIAPWISDTQVEQDLLISRVLISLFSNKLIAQNLAFRGGTALHKLFLHPPSRYSEDIDLVQINAGAIGPLMDAIHETLDGFLGTPKRKQAEDSVTLTYRADSEIPPVVPLKLKVEINTREHFNVLGYREESFSMESGWFSGNCKLTTYSLDELLGTKLRALYQRRKGRDLFDLWLGLTLGNAKPATVVQTFRKYMETEGNLVSKKEFRENLIKKMQTKSFLADTDNLLRPTIDYDQQKAFQLIDQQLIRLL
jgi:predicted nucleotidyltransferase component of viral defense system